MSDKMHKADKVSTFLKLYSRWRLASGFRVTKLKARSEPWWGIPEKEKAATLRETTLP